MQCTQLKLYRLTIQAFVSFRGLAPDVVRHPVTNSPSNDERLSHRVAKPTTKKMYLMADLRHLNGQVILWLLV